MSSEIVKAYTENAKRGIDQKSYKFEQNAMPYIYANMFLKLAYRHIKDRRGLSGTAAWTTWRQLQRRMLLAYGLKAGAP